MVRQLPEFARGALHEILLHRGDSRILAEATQMLKAAGVQQDLAVQYKQVSRAWEVSAVQDLLTLHPHDCGRCTVQRLESKVELRKTSAGNFFVKQLYQPFTIIRWSHG